MRNFVEAQGDEPLPTAEDEKQLSKVAFLEGASFCPCEYDGWLCTRPKGHAGRHVAHGTFNALAAWEDDDASVN